MRRCRQVVRERADRGDAIRHVPQECLDHEFREVVKERAHVIIAAGGIVVSAGHDHEMLHRLCMRAFWLEGGRVRMQGEFASVRPPISTLTETLPQV